MNSLQTILGANGTISSVMAIELKSYTNRIRLVSRHPRKVNEMDELFPADLTDSNQVEKAVAGSDIVYLMVGLEYNLKVWQNAWPQLMRATLDACIKHNAKLVFFDNVYMYDDKAVPHMTEESPLKPSSKKGRVRKQIADMFMAANKKHSFTYTPDAAKAKVLLGNTPDAFNQVWRLPSDPKTLTASEIANLFSKEMNAKVGISILPMWFLKILGLFIPFLREMPEMMDQYNRDYFFDSSKFSKRFEFLTTSYAEGVKLTVAQTKT